MTNPGPDIFELALACYRAPLAHQNRLASAAPLPPGMTRLLWLANGSPETLEGAVRQTGAKADELRDAARFLVQQLCFARGASQYRVLGLEPGAAAEQVKEHHRLLIRLFHPDRVGGGASWTDHFASRVNEAWTVLSRPQPRAAYDARQSQPPSRAVVPATVGQTDPPPASSVRAPDWRWRKAGDSRPRFAVPRRWLPVLVLSGVALAAALAVWGVYETRPPLAAPTVFPHSAPTADPEPSSFADPVDRSAITALLAAPDWQALGQREHQARQRASESHMARERLEQAYREQLATDVILLEQIRAERSQLEEQLRAERTWSERLAAEQAKLEQLKAEQVQVEQARDERLAVEQAKLEQLKAEQAKAEQMAEALRAEREQLEQAKLEQLRAEQVQAERARSERLAAEQAKLEQLRAEQVQAERARSERLAAEQAKLKQLKAEQAKAEQITEALRGEREQLKQTRLERAGATPVRQARPDPQPEQPADPAGASRLTAVAPDAEALTIKELDGLIKRYTNAYRRGDLDSLMVLFATDVRGKGGSDRDRIRRDYGTLFGTHWVERMQLRDLSWVRGGGSVSAAGRYELWLRRRDNGESIQLAGTIRFEVRKRDGQPSIVAIDYDWPGY
ncbi:MAG: DnaJ domain-containing protein [Candidatus Competibacteraceae bacterium]|nr:MAG: DnaJ domain-containing protein [Candidatus Competibacteraceae bacterium]